MSRPTNAHLLMGAHRGSTRGESEHPEGGIEAFAEYLHFSSVFKLTGKERQAKNIWLRDIFGDGHLFYFPPE